MTTFETSVIPLGNLNISTAYKYADILPMLEGLGEEEALTVKPPEGVKPQSMAASIRKMVEEKMDMREAKLRTRVMDDGLLALWFVAK